MNIYIKLHKNDLPDDLELGNVLAVDGEFMGLNIRRDPLCIIQISSGNNDAHIIQLDRSNYKAPNLVKILSNKEITKIFHENCKSLNCLEPSVEPKATNHIKEMVEMTSSLISKGFA